MSYRLVPTSNFARELKRLAKKHPGLKKSIKDLSKILENKPKQGSPLGKHCYKIRITSPSKSTGKSGGFRVITNVLAEDSTVFLLSIYDKSEVSTLRASDIKRLLKDL